jgi:hypothetical protein
MGYSGTILFPGHHTGNKLVKMWKKVLAAYFKALFVHDWEKPRKNQRE